MRCIGKTWDGADLLATPAYTLVDALIAFDQGQWRYALNATNLFDRKYIATCLERGDCWYGERRQGLTGFGFNPDNENRSYLASHAPRKPAKVASPRGFFHGARIYCNSFQRILRVRARCDHTARDAPMKPVTDPPQWSGLDLAWVYSELLVSISRKTQCIHRARDVLHDSLLRYVLSQKREEIRQPHAYLRTVVGSVLSDLHRDASRFQSLDDPALYDGALHASGGLLPRDPAPSAERLADLQQRLQAVQRILDCLPPRCREVFWLFRVEGCTQPDIAARLRISLNMVERHVMRALVDLRNARALLNE